MNVIGHGGKTVHAQPVGYKWSGRAVKRITGNYLYSLKQRSFSCAVSPNGEIHIKRYKTDCL